MAYVKTLYSNWRYPDLMWPQNTQAGTVNFVPGTLDSLNDTFAQVGQVQWEDFGTGKTISKIHLVPGTNTSAVATLTVGYQTVTNAFPHKGSGSYLRSGTIDASTITSDTAFSVTVSGSGTVSHYDLIAVVAEFTAYTSGTLQLDTLDCQTPLQLPTCTLNTTLLSGVPLVLLEANDGTFGILKGGGWATTCPLATFGQTAEVGLRFTLPFNCKVDGAAFYIRGNSASALADLYMYTDVLGTPAAVSGFPISCTGQHFGGSTSSSRGWIYRFGQEITLTKDTSYGLVMRNTSATAINFEYGYVTVGSASHWDALTGGRAISLITRTGGTGAFTETTTSAPLFDLFISSIDDGTGGTGLTVSRSLPLVV